MPPAISDRLSLRKPGTATISFFLGFPGYSHHDCIFYVAHRLKSMMSPFRPPFALEFLINWVALNCLGKTAIRIPVRTTDQQYSWYAGLVGTNKRDVRG